ncbi:hypothetical protein [Pseudomonas sp. Eqa60]|uniref:ParA family protein n=1 Tax=Pseudomonas sp. Eqa60 TaxID=2799184 RepID=UPI0032AEEE6D
MSRNPGAIQSIHEVAAVASFKGGVGKTTTSAGIGAFYAEAALKRHRSSARQF